jgi:hypothetical protein
LDAKHFALEPNLAEILELMLEIVWWKAVKDREFDIIMEGTLFMGVSDGENSQVSWH